MYRWSTPDQEPEPIVRPERPIGVSVLTIWNGMVAGLFPIIMLTITLMSEGETAGTNPILCLSPLLSAAIIFTAIGAWRGHDGSRLGHIIVLVLYYGTLAFNTYATIVLGAPRDERMLAYVRVTGYLFWVVVNTWYFLRPKTIAFYRHSIHKR
jgi:hypothetical protein